MEVAVSTFALGRKNGRLGSDREEYLVGSESSSRTSATLVSTCDRAALMNDWRSYARS